MGKSNGTVNIEDISIEQVQGFYEWLQGKSCPENLHFENKLNLSEEQAFSVIYFLQEYLEIFPDNYERCQGCGCIFDMDCEGTSINIDTEEVFDYETGKYKKIPEEMYGLYCDDCRPEGLFRGNSENGG